jgi:hypothetical protein
MQPLPFFKQPGYAAAARKGNPDLAGFVLGGDFISIRQRSQGADKEKHHKKQKRLPEHLLWQPGVFA